MIKRNTLIKETLYLTTGGKNHRVPEAAQHSQNIEDLDQWLRDPFTHASGNPPRPFTTTLAAEHIMDNLHDVIDFLQSTTEGAPKTNPDDAIRKFDAFYKWFMETYADKEAIIIDDPLSTTAAKDARKPIEFVPHDLKAEPFDPDERITIGGASFVPREIKAVNMLETTPRRFQVCSEQFIGGDCIDFVVATYDDQLLFNTFKAWFESNNISGYKADSIIIDDPLNTGPGTTVDLDPSHKYADTVPGRPTLDDAIEWDIIDPMYKYAAMDADGKWTAFSGAPTAYEPKSTTAPGFWKTVRGQYRMRIVGAPGAAIDWRESLIERPSK